jgi:hypothetical protein
MDDAVRVAVAPLKLGVLKKDPLRPLPDPPTAAIVRENVPDLVTTYDTV